MKSTGNVIYTQGRRRVRGRGPRRDKLQRVPVTGGVCDCPAPKIRCRTDGNGALVTSCLACGTSQIVERRRGDALAFFAPQGPS